MRRGLQRERYLREGRVLLSEGVVRLSIEMESRCECLLTYTTNAFVHNDIVGMAPPARRRRVLITVVVRVHVLMVFVSAMRVIKGRIAAR